MASQYLRSAPITGELARAREIIEVHAKDFGLDYYPVIFEVCDYDTINILASQGGFPMRYPHWRFGMEYDQMSKSQTYGLHRIYEMVVNTSPCYAYLLKSNNMVDQKTVMGHVFGHADFFKNNAWFSGTDRNMMDVMANHGTKIRRYMEKYGQERVEQFIDTINSLENLLDPDVLFLKDDVFNRLKKLKIKSKDLGDNDEEGQSAALRSFIRSKKRYDDNLRPEGPFDASKEWEEDESAEAKTSAWNETLNPELPTRDILWFLMRYAPLKEWEADIIGILREEAYYFLPQRMTKIMNEGWASYWHSKIMTTKVLEASEVIDFADHHAGVMAMGPKNINPYKIGIELFRDIEYRWNTGRFGKDYNECQNMQEKALWNKDLGLGRQKIFDVRKTHNDVTFIDEFLTPEFCDRMQIFTYKYNSRTGRNEIESRDFEAIKSKPLTQLSNGGQPMIRVIDANHSNRGEILLEHTHMGVDLDLSYAQETMRNLYKIWKRPVALKTSFDDQVKIFRFDGREFK